MIPNSNATPSGNPRAKCRTKALTKAEIMTPNIAKPITVF